MKELKNQILWKFELGSQENMKVPTWIIVGIRQKDKADTQNLNNDTFFRLPFTSAQSIIGTINPETGIMLNFDDDDFSHGYGQIN